MLKRNWKKMMKSRKTAWMLLLCLMAGAVCGTVYKNSRPEDIENTADSALSDEAVSYSRDEVQKQGADQTGKNESKKDTQNSGNQDNSGQIQADAAGNAEVKDGKTADSETDESKKEAAAAASGMIKTENLDFLTEGKLSWPVEGEVLLEFNGEETVYFPTLNLYKCNQAIVIQSEEGTPVCAPAEGIIVSIGMDEQIGNYLVMDIGDGYQVKMGQLKDIKVSEGTSVKEGDLLAYIAAPTRCYSLEGDNLYLELTENGTPVDPLDYLSYQQH